MRFISLFVAAMLLAACATAPAAPTQAPAPTSPPASGSSRAERLLASAGRGDAATRAEIENALGRPDVARQDGAGAALTYRLDSCALLLLFVADGRNALRLAEVRASARREGDPAPSVQQCAAEASGR